MLVQQSGVIPHKSYTAAETAKVPVVERREVAGLKNRSATSISDDKDLPNTRRSETLLTPMPLLETVHRLDTSLQESGSNELIPNIEPYPVMLHSKSLVYGSPLSAIGSNRLETTSGQYLQQDSVIPLSFTQAQPPTFIGPGSAEVCSHVSSNTESRIPSLVPDISLQSASTSYQPDVPLTSWSQLPFCYKVPVTTFSHNLPSTSRGDYGLFFNQPRSLKNSSSISGASLLPSLSQTSRQLTNVSCKSFTVMFGSIY